MTDAGLREIYRQRASASRERADAAINATIAKIHMELHDRYLALADGRPMPAAPNAMITERR